MLIHVGVGGWTFAPWRGTFYPPGLPHAQELAYAAGRLTAIEINGTFYRTQSAASFASWARAVSDGFVFALKGPRGATYRTALAESEPSVQRFLSSGLVELGDRLGPILWQFPPTRRYDPAAMAAFLALLPATHGGLPLRHVVEARHESFATPEWFNQLRRSCVAAAIVESGKHRLLGDLTAPFVYARLERNDAAAAEGYSKAGLDAWAARARAWAAGETVTNLPLADTPSSAAPRECFLFFISGDKVRAPDAAQALLARLQSSDR